MKVASTTNVSDKFILKSDYNKKTVVKPTHNNLVDF